MNKSKYPVVLTLLAFLFLYGAAMALPAGAAQFEIFIRNRPYTGPLEQRGGSLFIPIEEFASYARLTIHKSDDAVCVTDPKTGDADCPLGKGGKGIFVNGKPYEYNTCQKDGMNYVSLRKMADLFGATYNVDSAGAINIGFPKSGVSLQEMKSAEDKAKKGKDFTFVFYWNNTGGACETMLGYLKEIEGNYADRIDFVRVNLQSPGTETFEKYIKIFSPDKLPVIMMLGKNGRIIKKNAGPMKQTELENFIKNYSKER
jgi:hypothetical protein